MTPRGRGKGERSRRGRKGHIDDPQIGMIGLVERESQEISHRISEKKAIPHISQALPAPLRPAAHSQRASG